MKCPKCGSDKDIMRNLTSGCRHIAFCINCETQIFRYNGELFDHQLSFKEQEKLIYQQRLDKVLAKFEKISPYNYNLEINRLLNINYSNKEFNLVSFDTELAGYEFVVVSLDTVEHILKDKEARDGKISNRL